MICLIEIGNLEVLIEMLEALSICESFDLDLKPNTIYTSCWNKKIYKRGEIFKRRANFKTSKIELFSKTRCPLSHFDDYL